MNLNAVLDYLEKLDNPDASITICPPDVDELTDEDSADEEENVPIGSHNLNRNQLLAQAEIDLSSDDEIIQQPPCKNQKALHTKWELEESPTSVAPYFPEGDYSKYRDFSPANLFELYFDDSIIDHIIKESRIYGVSKNWKDIQVSQQEMRVFLAILIISGYNPLPSKAHYWATKKDFRNNAIYNAMRQDRFDDNMKYLHFYPNHNLYKDNKYCKLRPLVAHLQQKFISHFVPSSYISHNEVMVEYFGKHSCKQAIRNKSIRFGYKVWCQNTPLGYLITFDLYQDKTYKGNEEMETRFGKCASTVLHLLDQYSNDKKHLPYHIWQGCPNDSAQLTQTGVWIIVSLGEYLRTHLKDHTRHNRGPEIHDDPRRVLLPFGEAQLAGCLRVQVGGPLEWDAGIQ